jgi:HPt (histidine-containing phosphotransfer) domain-containing protein
LNRLGSLLKSIILGLLFLLAARPDASAATPVSGVVQYTEREGRAELLLKGEWRFFWKQLITPEQLPKALGEPPAFLKVPGGWNDFKDPATGKDVGGLGYATYFIEARGISKIPDPAFYMPFASSSYKLWILDAKDPTRIVLTMENGVVGTTKETSIPQQDARYVRLPADPALDSVYVLIQVANFHWIQGGLFFDAGFSEFSFLQRDQERNKIINLILLGIVIIIGLYNLSLFLHRRTDYGSLYLGIFCFALSFQYARTAPNFLSFLHEPTTLYFWLHRSAYFVAGPVMGASLNSFVRANFPNQSWRSFEIFCWVYAAALAVPLIFMQTSMPMLIFRIYQMGWLISFGVLIQIMRAWRQKEEAAFLSLLGAAMLIAAFANDATILMKIREGTLVLPYGVALFVLMQSQIVALRFTKAFHQSERLGRELQKEVERQTRDIKSILKHIKQGIFTLVPPFKQAGDQYSDHLVQLLGKESITGQTLDQLLLKQSDLNADSKSQIEAALDATLGENSLAYEMNEDSLVKELSFQKSPDQDKSIFEVDWNPIVNKEDTVEKILVSLRDVTEVRRLKSVAEQREEDIRILIELVQIPEEKFQRFLAKTKEYIAENRDIILNKSEPRAEIIRRLFMNMHTIKGAARTYSLKSISSSAHDVEQYYAALQRDEVEWNDGKLIADLDEVHRILQHYQLVGEERLGWNSSEKLVKISRSKLEQALYFLQSIPPATVSPQQEQKLKVMTDQLGMLCFDSLAILIEEASRGLDSIARDLNKSMPIIVVPQGLILIKEKGADFLYSVLLHLIRNSMDHGIEAPEQRAIEGKPIRGTITIDIAFAADHLTLSYKDDGHGLDLMAIQNKGLEQGLIKPGHNYTDLDIASLIFVSGFSTKNAVSEISGRGVGLNAVATYCQDIGVSIHIRLENSKDRTRVPFRFEMVLPRSLFWIAQSHSEIPAKAS